MSALVIETAPLSIAGIRRRLRAPIVGRQLYLCGRVESTNATLSRLARSGAPEGTVVLAEAQTAGRGRLGQAWFSPPDVNLYASVLFRGPLALKEAPLFSLVGGLALADAVRESGGSPAIKWPNDVLVDGRKMGGSLIECGARGDEVEYLVLGVGANLNVDLDALGAALGPAAAGATSLRAAIGRDVDRDAFAASYLNALDARVSCYRGEGPGSVLEAWSERDILTGRQVEIRGAGYRFIGRVAGVDLRGRLVVQDAVGERRTVSTEEICVCD
jgi:BirA family transcriptional regulator, biotin operon repressor / biotin---[acetyl-CoA-carboxylase] ligase